ncbi:MAG: Ppx/GppA family phosphatase [Pseudomonadota bacterium]
MTPTSPHSTSNRRAVVDIGSNSVRLVIYDGPARAPIQICNEKALCGLGKGVGGGAPLDPEAVASALGALERFRAVLAVHGDPPVKAVATAAVRDASDGAEFLDAARARGFDAELIGGSREAELAALGVLSFNPQAEGVVGDMGGGSLELTAVSNGDVGRRVSLPIGPFRLLQATGGSLARAERIVAEALDGVGWLNGARGRLYAVGGAWRAVGRIHMRLRRYPLPILQQYDVACGDAVEICDLLSHQSPQSLEEIPGLPRKRIETLPLAAFVLKAVLLRMDATSMTTSAGGVREGLLFEDLGAEARRTDPLVAGTQFFAERLSPTAAFGAAAEAFVAPLFDDAGAGRLRLARAAARLVDIGAYFHPDLRGAHAADTVVRAPLAAISHAERAVVALALFVRHEGRRANPPEALADMFGVASPEALAFARRLGAALRLAGALSPKAAEPLRAFRLSKEPDAIVLTAPRRLHAMIDSTPLRRLDSLAAAFDVAPRVDVVS